MTHQSLADDFYVVLDFDIPEVKDERLLLRQQLPTILDFTRNHYRVAVVQVLYNSSSRYR